MKNAIAVALVWVLSLFASLSLAQEYPARQVRLIVIDPPGSAVDIASRIIAERLSSRWNQPVVVENRPGASGTIAAGAAAKSAPDGYTLLMTGTLVEAIVPFAVEKLPYDYKTDLVPVAEVCRLPFVLVLPGTSAVKSFDALVALAKSKPGGLNVGGTLRGSTLHLTWELIKRELSLNSTYVAYQGSSQLQADLLNGQLDVAIDSIGAERGFLQAGRVKAIAVTGASRSSVIPATPTLQEVGLKNMDLIGWIAVMAPKGTPAERMRIVESAMIEAVRADGVKERLSELGYMPTGADAKQLAATIARDRARLEPLVKELGIKMN